MLDSTRKQKKLIDFIVVSSGWEGPVERIQEDTMEKERRETREEHQVEQWVENQMYLGLSGLRVN